MISWFYLSKDSVLFLVMSKILSENEGHICWRFSSIAFIRTTVRCDFDIFHQMLIIELDDFIRSWLICYYSRGRVFANCYWRRQAYLNRMFWRAFSGRVLVTERVTIAKIFWFVTYWEYKAQTFADDTSFSRYANMNLD